MKVVSNIRAMPLAPSTLTEPRHSQMTTVRAITTGKGATEVVKRAFIVWERVNEIGELLYKYRLVGRKFKIGVTQIHMVAPIASITVEN